MATNDPGGGAGEILYQVPAIAAFLGLPIKVARHRIEAGEIPTFKIGRSRCARRSTLLAWLAEQEGAAAKNKEARHDR